MEVVGRAERVAKAAELVGEQRGETSRRPGVRGDPRGVELVHGFHLSISPASQQVPQEGDTEEGVGGVCISLDRQVSPVSRNRGD